MKHEANLVNVRRSSVLHLDPALTGEEAIVLRALAAGQTDRQVRKGLRMTSGVFFRMMRDMREKIGTPDNISLIVWAKRQIKGADQRIDRPDRYARPA